MQHGISININACELPKSTQRSAGRWTQQEHRLFVMGLARYGKNWKKIERLIQTRTGSQIRSHAQKYFNKLAKHSDKTSLHYWEAQTSLPNYQGTKLTSDFDGTPIPSKSVFNLREAYSEESENPTTPYPSKTSHCLFEEFSANQTAYPHLHNELSFQMPVIAKDCFSSSFFEHIFRSPFQVLNSDFYELYVDHLKPGFEDSQLGVKKETKQSKRKRSFTLFQTQELDEGALKEKDHPEIRIVPATV